MYRVSRNLLVFNDAEQYELQSAQPTTEVQRALDKVAVIQPRTSINVL